MSATKAEIVVRVWNELGKGRRGQAPQEQDKKRLNSAYDEVYADFKTEGLNVWPSDGSVPTELVPYMVALMSFNGIGAFSVSNERAQRIILISGPDGEKAKMNVRRLITPEFESLEDPQDF